MEDAAVLPFHNTSSGLAILGFSKEDFVDHILSQPLTQRTAETQTDPMAIRALLPAIRATGMAESVSGFEQDVHSFAMPIFDSAAHVRGALAVAAPTVRMTSEHKSQIQSELRKQAVHLTRLLGGFLPDGFPSPSDA